MKPRWILNKDKSKIVKMEKYNFNAWDKKELDYHLMQNPVSAVCWEEDSTIRSYIIYANYEKEVEILKLLVHPEYRRRGFGSLMLADLKKRLYHHNRRKIFILANEYNVGGQLFLKANGFRCENIYNGYFQKPDFVGVDKVDAYQFEFVKQEKIKKPESVSNSGP